MIRGLVWLAPRASFQILIWWLKRLKKEAVGSPSWSLTRSSLNSLASWVNRRAREAPPARASSHHLVQSFLCWVRSSARQW
eukprot:1704423-Pyramimonas_sp.AAC.1